MINGMINFHWPSKCKALFKSLQSIMIRFTHLITRLTIVEIEDLHRNYSTNMQVITQNITNIARFQHSLHTCNSRKIYMQLELQNSNVLATR
jgi:hypothetical protein